MLTAEVTWGERLDLEVRRYLRREGGAASRRTTGEANGMNRGRTLPVASAEEAGVSDRGGELS